MRGFETSADGTSIRKLVVYRIVRKVEKSTSRRNSELVCWLSDPQGRDPVPSAKIRDETARQDTATTTKEFKTLGTFPKNGTIKLPGVLEPISCQERRLKLAGNNLRSNFGIVCTFPKIGTN